MAFVPKGQAARVRPAAAGWADWAGCRPLPGRVPWGYPEVEGPMSSPSAANLKVVIFRPYAGPSLKCQDEVFSA